MQVQPSYPQPPAVPAGPPVGIEELLAAAQAQIRRFSPAEAWEALQGTAIVVDIRPLEQRRRDGLIPGAAIVARNVLEWRLDPRGEHRDPALASAEREVILVCNEGYQSSLAALTLRQLGVDAGDVIGGVQAWRRDGLPLLASLPSGPFGAGPLG